MTGTRSIYELIEASSLGSPAAKAIRARYDKVFVQDRLTGMPEEQADWDRDCADAAKEQE